MATDLFNRVHNDGNQYSEDEITLGKRIYDYFGQALLTNITIVKNDENQEKQQTAL